MAETGSRQAQPAPPTPSVLLGGGGGGGEATQARSPARGQVVESPSPASSQSDSLTPKTLAALHLIQEDCASCKAAKQEPGCQTVPDDSQKVYAEIVVRCKSIIYCNGIALRFNAN